MTNTIDTFLGQLNLITPIPAKELKKLKAISNIAHIKTGEYFLKQGEKSPNIAFVVSGLFRIVYLTEDGKEFTKSFLPEQEFLAAYSALIEDRESYFSIEALENSTVIVINYNKWEELFQNEISWYKMRVHVLERAFCKKEAREREFLLYDAATRYESFLNSYPNLKNRIKQQVIASYLGITPVTLSNLRKTTKN